MNTLRKEYNLVQERRKRSIEQLVKEAIINVLSEQELDMSVGQQAATQPQQPVEEQPPPVATPDTVPKQYTVDDMIQELNAVRSGRSFTDPEIYGRLVTFFKNLEEDQRTHLDTLLKQIAELVTGVEDTAGGQEQPAPQTNQAQPTPPGEAPQQSAPMPGAQQAAGAAGVGQV
jgi:hypothetical protein